MENAFRDGEVKTTGTDIDRIMPPVSRFGGSGRAAKKQTVIDKLKAFFEKYFGIGNKAFVAEPEKPEEAKATYYDFSQPPLGMVAEEPVKYGKKNDEGE